MNAWKYEIISYVEQDIPLVRFTHSWYILVDTREISWSTNFIFPYVHLN